MRFASLDLIRYGHFDGRTLAFPERRPDLHLVCGPNEAGKSTLRAAIEDLLFGFPHSSPYAFRHAYGDLRVGARLQGRGRQLDVRRRKGSRNTLLDAQEQPLGEAALQPFLADTGKELFTRMLCLDHERLHRGGEAILQARDEIGRMLFTAGAGLEGLDQTLKGLEDEADTLWGPRRSTRRAYEQARQQWQEARKRQRDAELRGADWRRARQEVDRLERAHAQEEEAIREAGRRLHRLQRMRRVLPILGRIRDHEAGLRELGEPPSLPEDAAQRLDDAERQRDRALAQAETLARQIGQRQAEADRIHLDTGLLGQAEAIKALAERRTLVLRTRQGLPEQERRLASAREALLSHARELGWQAADEGTVRAALPPTTTLGQARAILERSEAIATRLQAASTALGQRQEELREIDAQMAATSEPPDLAPVEEALQALRQHGDPTAHLAQLDERLRDLQDRLDSRLRDLEPWPLETGALRASVFPSREQVQAQQDQLRAADEALAELQRSGRELDEAIADQSQRRQQMAATGEAVPGEALADARRHRESGWRWIRARFIDRSADDEPAPPPPGYADAEDPPGAYEAAVAAADQLADRRFEHAEVSAQLQQLEQSLERLEARRHRTREHRQGLEQERARLQQQWRALWAATPVTPDDDPAVMQAWLQRREQALEALAERDAAAAQRERERGRIEERARALADALRAAGVAPPAGLQPEQLAARAERLLTEARDAGARLRQLREQRARAVEALEKARAEHEAAEGDLAQWRAERNAALAALHLDPALADDPARTALATLEAMREAAQGMDEIRRDQIEPMRTELARFDEDVAALMRALGRTPAPDPAEDVRQLSQALAEAQTAAERHQRLIKELAELRQDRERLEGTRQECEAVIRELCQHAGVDDPARLRAAIDRAAQHRKLSAERQAALEELSRAGDGKPREDLEAECADADPDTLPARVQELDEQLQALREAKEGVQGELYDARAHLDGMRGQADAAAAAADAEQGLAAMGEAAERYVQLRAASVLMRWALERYRREQQGPLLSRASELFARLTLGEFERLEAEAGDEQPRLLGIRAGGERVGVDGLSEGTRDQLYLALRAAAVEDYLQRAPALPFIADDLFINFDDQRARAGLHILAELATQTQVLLLTHHQHLADLAREALGEGVHLLDLGQESR